MQSSPEINLPNPFTNIFLQRKRNPDEFNNFNLTKNGESSNFEQKRGHNLQINKDNKNKNEIENQLETELDSIKIINDTNSSSNNSILNINSFSEKENKYKDKNIYSYNNSNINNSNINNSVYNILNNNINKPNINEIVYNFNSKADDVKSINKNNYFKIINIDSEEKNRTINNTSTLKEESELNNCQNNNEVKVLKNNKAVYVNSYLLNSPSTSKNLKKLNKITFINKNKRSSRYRGVSKNGNQWQVLMMHKKGKSYVGSYTSEETAARIYDILAIKYKGIKARTNFKYTYQQIKKIGDSKIDIKASDINEIITRLTLDCSVEQ